MKKAIALEIINSSINSAIFIDEKAKSFYSNEPIDTNIIEEKLSVDLYETFKNNGKKISIHKFSPTDIYDKNIIKYLFNNRDLILLDWELDETQGEKYSLELIKKTIKTPNINFCCIYSNSTKYNNINNYLQVFFSVLTKDDYIKIRDTFNYIDKEDIDAILHKKEEDIDKFIKENSINLKDKSLSKIKKKSKKHILRSIYLSLVHDQYIIPDSPLNYEIEQTNSDSYIINNTFIFTLKKEVDTDKDYINLINKITDQVILTDRSFFQLLGLEMHSLFNSKEHFIDKTILKNSTQSILSLRKQFDGNGDYYFNTIIKKLILEQSSMKLRTKDLKLLKPEYLDRLENSLSESSLKDEDVATINTFLNSVEIDDIENADLNFGDVFKNKTDYYLCITPLCDCYRPEKIEHKYTFAKGTSINVKTALSLGDTSFVSYLPDGKIVNWANLEFPVIAKKSTKNTKSNKNADLSKPESSQVSTLSEELEATRKELENTKDELENTKDELENTKDELENTKDELENTKDELENTKDELEKFRYKPLFIKPMHMFIYDRKIANKKITSTILKFDKFLKKHEFETIELDYVTTLRTEYTQRVINQASSHSIRVGVDLIKKDKKR